MERPPDAETLFDTLMRALLEQSYEVIPFTKLPDPNRSSEFPQEAAEQSRLDESRYPERSVVTIPVGDALEVKTVLGARASGTGWRIWPASRLLAECVARNANVLSRAARLLELGAGCGLVGLAAACIAPASTVTITDYKEAVISRIRRAAELNGYADCA